MANLSYPALVLPTGTTASSNGLDMDNLSANWATFVIDITTLTGTTPTATFTIEGKDPVSGKYYTILASTALNATGTTVLRVGPTYTNSANLIAQDSLPRNFRVRWTAGGTVTNIIATVGVQTND